MARSFGRVGQLGAQSLKLEGSDSGGATYRTRNQRLSKPTTQPTLIQLSSLSWNDFPQSHSPAGISDGAYNALAIRRWAKRWGLVLWVRHFGLPFAPRSQMKDLFNKKPKKSLKSPQRHISLGIPTNIAAGPLGFRAELDIGPKGEQRRLYHDRRQMGPI